MIKRFLRKWLEIPDASHVVTEKILLTERKIMEEGLEDRMKMRGLYQSVSANYENTLHEITELHKKFDVLCETLGIVIVGSTNEEGPKIISIKQDGMLGDARTYINAAQIADKVINIQYQCLQDQAKLFDQLKRKR